MEIRFRLATVQTGKSVGDLQVPPIEKEEILESTFSGLEMESMIKRLFYKQIWCFSTFSCLAKLLSASKKHFIQPHSHLVVKEISSQLCDGLEGNE